MDFQIINSQVDGLFLRQFGSKDRFIDVPGDLFRAISVKAQLTIGALATQDFLLSVHTKLLVQRFLFKDQKTPLI